MPYVGDDIHPARKRRRDDEAYRLYAAPEKQPAATFYVLSQALHDGVQARKALPPSKRPRTIDEDGQLHARVDALPPTHWQRASLSPWAAAPPDKWVAASRTSFECRRPTARPAGGALLTPCHICHRKPTKKSDLDSFAECLGCSERTCFVCIRECQGWNVDVIPASPLSKQAAPSPRFNDPRRTHNEARGPQGGKGWDAGGHRAMICSRCCIERGAEGEIVCLGCLSGMEAA